MIKGFNVKEFLKLEKIARDFSVVIQGKVVRIGNVSQKTPQGTIIRSDEEKGVDAEETEEERIIREEKEGKLYVIKQTEGFLFSLPENFQEYEGMTEEEIKNEVEKQVSIFLEKLFLEINEAIAAGKKSVAYQTGANRALSMVGGYLFIEPKKWED